MKKFIYIFASLYLIALGANAQDLKFGHLTIKEKLSHNTVYCFLQDSKGFIWVGTQDGLNRYDGYKFEIFQHIADQSHTLSNNHINALYEDSHQNIWVGTNGGGLQKYDSKYHRFISIKEISGNSVNAFLEDTNKTLWVAANNILFYLNAKSEQFVAYPTFTQSGITSFLQLDKDNLMVATYEEGFYILNIKTNKTQHFSHQTQSNSLCDNSITHIYKDINGHVWIGTRKGLDRFDPHLLTFEHFSQHKDTKKGILSDVVFQIIGKGNKMWFATENGGLSELDLKTMIFTHYLPDNNNAESINDICIRSLYLDRQNRLWVGAYSGGINVADPHKEKFGKPAVLLKNKAVNSILKDSKNRLWIGTEGGLVVNDGQNTTYYNHNPKQVTSLANNSVISVYEDNKNRIWVGTWAGGLSLFDEQTKGFTNFRAAPTNPSKLSDPNLYNIYQSSQTQQMLAVSWYGGFHILTDEVKQNFLNFSHNPQDQSSIINNSGKIIYEDSKKNIWVGATGGLNLFDMATKKFKRYLNDEKDFSTISNNVINAILEDSKGRLWIGTQYGLNMKKAEHFITYTTANGLSDNTVNGILEDKKGNLWLSTNKGITKFDPQTAKCRKYDDTDGLQSNQFRTGSYFKAKDGQLFFGGVNGLNAFYPDSIKDNPFLPTVLITDFRIFNAHVKVGQYDSLLKQHISQTKEITLTYQYSVFSIEFVALNFTNPEKNTYAYFLEGFEKDWNYVGSRRGATYTNLDAGTYTFRVKASNNDGLWNEEGASLKIIVLPPWWETWWFRGLIILFFISSGGIFYHIRINAVKKQNEKLQKIVAEKTRDLQLNNEALQTTEEELRQNMEELETSQELLREQKQTIETSFHQLNTQNTKVNDSIRYAQRIQNAILPHADSLNHAFAEHFVIFKPKDVVSGDFYWYLEINQQQSIFDIQQLDIIDTQQLDINLQQNYFDDDKIGKTQQQNYFDDKHKNKDEQKRIISVNKKDFSIQKLNKEQQQLLKKGTSKKFIAVVDCTGHGIPGAFMSMIGNTLLYEIINAKHIFEPHLILEELHLGILNALNRKDAEIQDGMDIALCCIEEGEGEQVKVLFSGAKRPLYYFSKQELREVQANKKSIGQAQSAEQNYDLHTLILDKGDTLYMTTDGWVDIINPERKRFGSKQFKEMLLKAAYLPLSAQQEVFLEILANYQQGAEQRDDVLVVGVKI